jgi:transposase InsO family protein
MQPNTKSRLENPPPARRIEAIDQFRGFAILLMVLADYFNNISTIPAWLKRATDIGYTIMDLFSRSIVGWAIERTLNDEFSRSALRMALEQCKPKPGLLHHSTRANCMRAMPTSSYWLLLTL